MTDFTDQSAPHLVVVPLMAQGHMIPMTDLALLLATRGARVSLITTPVNAIRLRATATHAALSGLPLTLVELPLPCTAAGLSEGCENVDLVPSAELYSPFFKSLYFLADPLKNFLQAQPSAPTCIIADQCMPWTMEVARELRIPRFVFHGPSCFFLLCTLKLAEHGFYEKFTDSCESFCVPELPQRIEVSTPTARRFFDWHGMEDLLRHAQAADQSADGIVLNTFYELEPWYVDEFSRMVRKEVWPVGPVSLFHKGADEKAMRGNGSEVVDHGNILKWLDGREAGSVLFVSFGSLARIRKQQLVEIGSGLEASGVSFVWAVKQAEQSGEANSWLMEFTERNDERGLIMRGWVPQVLILTHPAVGGFMTHCGWNSTLEAVAAGVPMVTWPQFADQFLNAKLVVEVLKTGVGIGVRLPTFHLSETEAEMVKRDEVQKAVASVVGGGEKVEREEMRKRAKEFGEKARIAMEKGGASYDKLTQLIQQAIKFAGIHSQ